MTHLHFLWPWAFALLPLPLLVAWLAPRAEEQRPAALRIPFFTALRGGISAPGARRSRLWLALAALGWLALIVAAARPQWVGDSIEVPVSGRSLMLAVDISGSMATEDMVIGDRAMDRLTAVKAVAGDFIQRREGDRIGLILFGSRAYLQAPLTFDRKTVRTLLDEAQIGLAGRQTAIGDAIGLAIKRLRSQPEANRVLILLTDGANTVGNVDPLKAADLAAQEGIRIYTLGVGADSQLIRTPFGLTRVGGSDLDEPTLKAIAAKTGGEYFRARDVEGLFKIYALLDRIEPVSKDNLNYRPVTELYGWPLALALLMSLLTALGRAGVFRLPAAWRERVHA
ncbi:MAG TPA: VWA domain-containing protein [Gammaproteobacteria bacterium]|nr:VWA domain-containing protein [Gammaproteobacteria bacterium]